ncbi:hypothetical protein CMU40_04765 [Elizabethkingia anophelis]|nr:hypothetical protein [Elizabethkingia anophelis]MDV3725500.1 hypothetical protein [Elizabethkingia anophelis]MDV3728723.1 hypothetical protein [Elizabethkingia anophelis]MDV3742884.1 hypothetical protein [Elizabethkingia anophelis]MDV3765330.1 hypothetical protein [Elizabethkingia anophelis]
MNKKLLFILFLICIIGTSVLIYNWIFNREDMLSDSGSIVQSILWPLLTIMWYMNWKKAKALK